jgi:hypothetical protein
MSLLKKMNDLDYKVLKCFCENLRLIKSKDKLVKRKFRLLKFLHKHVGYLKSELLDMHPCYLKDRGFKVRLAFLKREFLQVQAFFDYM